MKKNLKKFLGLMLATAAVVTSVCACGDSGKEEKKEEIVVTFMNGDTELGKVTANAGEKVTGYENYEKDNDAEFLGWFETPTFLESSKKDLKTVTFDKDTTLYGSFKSANVAEDTRLWYVVGTGASPELKASNWAADVEASVKEGCQLKPTGKNTNEFAITLNLYAGDQFQVIHDWAWDGQRGFGYFTTIDETQMENGGGLGGSDSTSNVNVIMDGNYTITLTTNPDNEALDTLSVVRNGDASAAKEETPTEPEITYQVSDATGIVVKGSWVADWSENKDLTRVDGTNNFTITLDLEAATELYFMVFDNGKDTGIGLNGSAITDDASKAFIEESYNVKVKDAGKYTFTVNADTMTITVTK